MSQTSKIKKHELEKDVIRLKAEGFGSRLIARKLSEKTGENISHMAVQNYIKTNDKVLIETLTENRELREEMTNFLLDSYKQVREDYQEIYEELKAKFIELRNDPERFSWWIAITDKLIRMLETGLKRIDSLPKPENETEIPVQQEINVIKHIKEMWFTDMEPEIKGEELIFHKPKPELINDLMVWQRKRENNSRNY